MSDIFDSDEARKYLSNIEQRALAIGDMYERAEETRDLDTLKRILNTYPLQFLDDIIGIYPEQIDEELER